VNQPKPRRPASSRTSTSRPRKIAGRVDPVEPGAPAEATTSADATEAVETTAAPEAPAETSATSAAAASAASAAPEAPETAQAPEPTPAEPGTMAALFAGTALTRVLLVGLAILALVLAGQFAWVVTHRHDGSTVKPGEIAVPAGRPIILNQTDVDAGVDQAAKDAVVIIGRHYQHYDDDVAKAVDLVTDRFAPELKSAAAGAKQGILDKKVNVDVRVLYQGAVRANRTQVQALLFLNQWITKGVGKDRRITLTPYRVLVTMVHTNTGWLVDNIDTK
jgi:Mce-associated membrane protein